MIKITYPVLVMVISAVWLMFRIITWMKNKHIDIKREASLLLVYICIIVVVRFTFFPFSKVNGQIQPLVFDTARIFPPRVNFLPFVYLFDYPTLSEALLNLIGNTTMFIPLGIVWPAVFRELNTHIKVITAGVGISLCIEILQLPFADRVSDVDDLIMNWAGFLAGYGIYLLVKRLKTKRIQQINYESVS